MTDVAPSKRRKRPTSEEKGYKNWRPELVQSTEILTIDPDLIWQKFGTFGRYQVCMVFKQLKLFLSVYKPCHGIGTIFDIFRTHDGYAILVRRTALLHL